MVDENSKKTLKEEKWTEVVLSKKTHAFVREAELSGQDAKTEAYHEVNIIPDLAELLINGYISKSH